MKKICSLKQDRGCSIQNILQGISTSQFPCVSLQRVKCGEGCPFPRKYTLYETFVKVLQFTQSLLVYKLCSTQYFCTLHSITWTNTKSQAVSLLLSCKYVANDILLARLSYLGCVHLLVSRLVIGFYFEEQVMWLTHY